MPTVPRYNKPQVQESPLPNVNTRVDIPIEALGGGRSLERVTQEASGLAQVGLNIYEAEMKKADDIAIRDADISTAELSNQIESGVRNLKGKDAARASDFVNENWQKGVDNITAGLKTDNQRMAADRILRARRMQLDESTNIHMANEFKRYDDQQFQAAIDTYRNEGSMKYNRPNAVANSIFQQEAEIDRYGERNKLPPEWTENAKAKARSGTYRDVLTRMLVDGNDQLAKQYEKGINKYILPDDVAILEKVRREEKGRKEDFQNEMLRQAYFLIGDSKATDKDKFSILENLLRQGNINLPQYDKMKGWVLDSYYNPRTSEISPDKVTERHLSIAKKFIELDNAEIDDKGRPVKAAKGNDVKRVNEFREYVANSKELLTPDLYEKWMLYTQADFDEGRAPKKNIFQSLTSILPLLPSLTPAFQMSLISKGIEIFDKSVTPQQAAESVAKLKEEAVVAGNPNRAKFQIGQRVTNPQGIDLEVVGFDETGNPRFKVLK